MTKKLEMRIAIFKMIMPILLSSVLEMMVGFISMALIGNLGSVAIGAMGLATRVRGIIWSVYKGIGIGAQVVTAQAVGAEDEMRVKDTIKQTIGSIFIISVLFLTTMLVFPSFWLSIFSAKDSLLSTAISVLRIVAFGMPFLGIVIIISGILQGKGDAFTPMVISIFMNITNAFVGIVLVKGLLGFPELGLKGAAYAMVISQGLAALMGLYFLVRKKGLISGATPWSFFQFTKPILKSVYSTGIPTAIESLFWNISSILIIRSILTYGNDAYASYQLGLQAESLAYMPMAGFQIAATAFVGRYLGAHDPKTAKTYFKEIVKWAFILSIFGGSILVFLPKQVLGIMTQDQNLIHRAVIYLIFCGLAQVPQNVAGVLGGALRGAGYTKLPMYAAGIGIYVVRVPIAMLSAFVFNWSVNIIFLAIALDMTVRLFLNSVLYFKTDIYENPHIVIE
ncbi:MAG: MATE family efflux transporter [Clostridia bacterium]|nr:MATE family efflux transporter [Clostridia bacterium]